MGSMSLEERKYLYAAFAQQLHDVARSENRAVLAILRRGLGKRCAYSDRDSWVRARLPLSLDDQQLEVYCFIASLFALHPNVGDGKWSLGEAFRQLDVVMDSVDSTKRRFTALLNSQKEDLPGRLRQAISLLKAHDIPLDWEKLLLHVASWNHLNRWVQRKWSREFWSERHMVPDRSDDKK